MTPSNVPSTYPTLPPTSVPTSQPTPAPSSSPLLPPSTAPSSIPSFSPTKAPSISPSIVPSVSPSRVPSLSPTLNPTAYSDYKLHIYVDLAISFSKASEIDIWFTSQQYTIFKSQCEKYLKEQGVNFLHFYQFYIEFTTLNNDPLINVTSHLPLNFTNATQALSSDIKYNNAYIYYQYVTYTLSISLQWIVHATLSVETVMTDFFENVYSTSQLQV